jgi:hypothetical protein
VRAGLFLFVLGALLLTAPREPFSDELRAQIATARAIASAASLDVAFDGDNPFTQLHDGRRYATSAPGLALWLVPAEALGVLVRKARVVPVLESASAALAVALVCLLFAAELRRRASRPSTTVIATLALAFSTGLCAAGRFPDGSALAALLLYAALVCARRPGTGSAVQASIASAALLLVEPSLAPAVIVLVVGAALEPSRRSPQAVLALAGPLAVGGALVLVHRAHVGWFPPPSGDLLQGLDGLLLSTGKSVFLYSPPLVLLALALPWWWRQRRGEAALGMAVMLATVLSVAALDRWHGDPAWGPRRLVPLLPVAAEPIALWLDGQRTRLQRGLAGVVLALGLMVQALGALYAPTAFPNLVTAVRLGSGAPNWFVEPTSELHFIPQFSPITGHRWMLSHALRRDRALDVDAPWKLLLPSTPRLDAQWATVKLDWFALEAPRPTVYAVTITSGVLMLAGLLLIARRLRTLS